MSGFPENKLSLNLQTAGFKASDQNAEPVDGSGLGRDKISAVPEPVKYLSKQQSASTGGIPRHMLLRERMTRVLPPEAVKQILNNPKPSQIRNGNSTSKTSKPSTKPAIPPKPNLKSKARHQVSTKPPIPPKPDLKSKASQAELLTGQTELPGASVEANRDIPPLVPSGRAGIKALPLPKTVGQIVKNGLEAKDVKSLQKAFTQYTTKVMDHVKEHYQGSSPPAELQEAFYSGMIELVTHGSYLTYSSFNVSGVTLFKPQNKKKLALQASTILQIQQAGKAKDGAMVGSYTSNLIQKGSMTHEKQEFLFRTCMGLEPVSGIALREDLKNTIREIDKLEIQLTSPKTDDDKRGGLEKKLQNKRSAVTRLRNMIQSQDQLMKEGERRSLDDVWDQNYALLEQRLTTRLHKDLQTYHDLPLFSSSRKAFLSADRILRTAEPELKKDAEGTAMGKIKLLEEEGYTVESLTRDILAERKAGIKSILEEAIKAYKPKS
ncbi:hypothetical protein NX722_07165 [Endozoicomonas gorgoniicola]|uniref:Uncharacterized protein n=1 Tax=Endozoicomonas gorgoniicola TaxID=1234144 RepID=A0ABT3MSR9_9GAMM|nr:hypothetical protein [Endozoicomonas gorgoniicola]MCW7552425.1 hypothetical protein [Endozoicomonas gorgoniicola]